MSTSPAEPTGVAPGDPAPKPVLSDGEGGRVDFTHPSIAGQTAVIRAARGTPEPAARQALAADLPAATMRWTRPGNRIEIGSWPPGTVATMSQRRKN